MLSFIFAIHFISFHEAFDSISPALALGVTIQDGEQWLYSAWSHWKWWAVISMHRLICRLTILIGGGGPFVGSLSFYHFNMIVSGACTAIVLVLTFGLMGRHAMRMSNPNEQIKYDHDSKAEAALRYWQVYTG